MIVIHQRLAELDTTASCFCGSWTSFGDESSLSSFILVFWEQLLQCYHEHMLGACENLIRYIFTRWRELVSRWDLLDFCHHGGRKTAGLVFKWIVLSKAIAESVSGRDIIDNGLNLFWDSSSILPFILLSILSWILNWGCSLHTVRSETLKLNYWSRNA